MSDIDKACVVYDDRATRGRAIVLPVARRLLLAGVLGALVPFAALAQQNGQWSPGPGSSPYGRAKPADCTLKESQLTALCTKTSDGYFWRWYDFDVYSCGKAPDPVTLYRTIQYTRTTNAPCNDTDYGRTVDWGETYGENWPPLPSPPPPPKTDDDNPSPPTNPPKPDWKDGERPDGRTGDPVAPPKGKKEAEENTPKQNTPRLENRNERSVIDALKAHPGTTTTTTTKPGTKGGLLETSKPTTTHLTTPTTTTTHTTTHTTTKIEGEHDTHTTTHETVNQTHTTTLKENHAVTRTTPTRLTNTRTETTTHLTTPHTLGPTRPMLSQPIRSTPQFGGGLRQGGGFHLRSRDIGPDKPKADKTDDQSKPQPPEQPKTDQ